GAFNTNVIKAVERYAANELSGASEVSLRIIGKKANQHFARRNANIASFDPAPTGVTALQVARETANRVIDDFQQNKVDRVFLAYNEFKGPGSQQVRIVQILPVAPAESAEDGKDESQVDYIYEPSKEVLLS